MVIVTKMAYPTESVREIAKRFLEAPQIPSYLLRRGPYISTNTIDGVSVLAIYELDRSKLADGFEYVMNSTAKYFGVPGFKHEIKVYAEAREALQSIDM